MKYIRNATALAAALFLAAPLTVCGSVCSANIQTLDTPAKASLSSADGMSNGAWIPSTGSAAVSSEDGYAGEYILFGIGGEHINFQSKFFLTQTGLLPELFDTISQIFCNHFTSPHSRV